VKKIINEIDVFNHGNHYFYLFYLGPSAATAICLDSSDEEDEPTNRHSKFPSKQISKSNSSNVPILLSDSDDDSTLPPQLTINNTNDQVYQRAMEVMK
jgi:hypothetical protein